MNGVLLAVVCWMFCVSTATAQAPSPAEPQAKKNYFDDPFFQVSSAQALCPIPEGPMYTADEQRAEAHSRSERGSSCYLAGQCTLANAYAYDKALAPQLQAALAMPATAQPSSVWVTVQRRIVHLQGCVANTAQARALEAAARSVPDVDAVLPQLTVGIIDKPNYKMAPPKASDP